MAASAARVDVAPTSSSPPVGWWRQEGRRDPDATPASRTSRFCGGWLAKAQRASRRHAGVDCGQRSWCGFSAQRWTRRVPRWVTPTRRATTGRHGGGGWQLANGVANASTGDGADAAGARWGVRRVPRRRATLQCTGAAPADAEERVLGASGRSSRPVNRLAPCRAGRRDALPRQAVTVSVAESSGHGRHRRLEHSSDASRPVTGKQQKSKSHALCHQGQKMATCVRSNRPQKVQDAVASERVPGYPPKNQ